MQFKVLISKLKTNLSALYLAYKRSDTPLPAKITAFITVCYALSPIDLIPDFIPILGYLDDMVILPLLIMMSIRLVPKPIMDECLEQSKDLWKNGKPKSWRYATIIVLIWALIAMIIIYKFVK